MKKEIFARLLMIFSLLLFIFGCAQPQGPAEQPEEFVDTGAFMIESLPTTAQVYIDNELKGDTPLVLYNFPVGQYKVVIKKEGYIDFEKTVTISVGRTEKIDAALNQVKLPAEEKKATEKEEEKIENKSATKLSKIGYSSFALYYDFEKPEFTETRTDKSDLFSRKYDNYIHFTIMPGSKINVMNKPVKEIAKEDCIFADTGVAQLFSKQTLCVQTSEGNIAALGWDTTPDEVEWLLLK